MAAREPPVIGGRQIAWFGVGFLSALALGLAILSSAARSQAPAATGDGFITRIRPSLPTPIPRRPITVPIPTIGDPSGEPMGRFPGLTNRDGVLSDPDPSDDPDRPTDPVRPPVVDGDPSGPPLADPQRDGVLIVPEPGANPDADDPINSDTRPIEDTAPFDTPPAGHDARAFDDGAAIEIEPILDRRPSRLARFEPYDPIGLRWGQFIVFPEVEATGIARSNVFRSSKSPVTDVGLEVRPSVRVVSDWRVHALELRAAAVTSFWNRFPSEDDRAYSFETRGRLDITRRTNIEALVGYQVEQEARGSINAAAGADDRTEVVIMRTAVTFNHRFNRLSIQLRGSVVDYDYQPVATATGAIITNDSRDLRAHEAAVRATWELKPALLAFAEAAFNWRAYDEAPSSDGIRRDSSGERVRLGISFGNSGEILRGEASIGYGTQRPDDSRLPEIAGILIDANLAWRVTALTSVLLTARTDVTESSVAGSGGGLARSAGVEVRHAFLRNLIATGALRYTHTGYEGVSLSESELVTALSAEYFLNREITLFARYQHTAFESTEVARNYNLGEVRVGLRLRR